MLCTACCWAEKRGRQVRSDRNQPALNRVQELVKTLTQNLANGQGAQICAQRPKLLGRIAPAAQPVPRPKLAQELVGLAGAKINRAWKVRVQEKEARNP